LLTVYRQHYVVTVVKESESLSSNSSESDDNDDNDDDDLELAYKPLFAFAKYDTCTVKVQGVTWPLKMADAKTQISTPKSEQLNRGVTYEIPAGYRRPLVGFIREIEFMTVDDIKSHNCLHRATYLIKILDLFAEELQDRAKDGKTSALFRSRILNPILQRQLKGTDDHEPELLKRAVGTAPGAAAKFYLEHDPLDPKWANILRRATLYLWTVRLSLRFLHQSITDVDYNAARDNTEALLAGRKQVPDEDFLASKSYYDFERKLIGLESLQWLSNSSGPRVNDFLPPIMIHALIGRTLAQVAGQMNTLARISSKPTNNKGSDREESQKDCQESQSKAPSAAEEEEEVGEKVDEDQEEEGEKVDEDQEGSTHNTPKGPADADKEGGEREGEGLDQEDPKSFRNSQNGGEQDDSAVPPTGESDDAA
jgi:hypothetical protein